MLTCSFSVNKKNYQFVEDEENKMVSIEAKTAVFFRSNFRFPLRCYAGHIPVVIFLQNYSE